MFGTFLGVDLKIKERGGDGGACSESEENDEEAAVVSGEQPAHDAPEHGRLAHHSPRRIGAGSYFEARRRGRALPNKALHRIAALLRFGMNLKSLVRAARGALER